MNQQSLHVPTTQSRQSITYQTTSGIATSTERRISDNIQNGRKSVLFEDKRYEEILQDNRKLKEVIEQLDKDNQQLKQMSGESYNLKQKYMITQAELEAAQQELAKLRTQLLMRNSQDAEQSTLVTRCKQDVSAMTQQQIKYQQGNNLLNFQEISQLNAMLEQQKKQVEEFLRLKSKYEQDIQTYKSRAQTLEMEIKQVKEHKNSQTQNEILRLTQEIARYQSEVQIRSSDKELYERTIQTLNEKMKEMDMDIQILIQAHNQNQLKLESAMAESRSNMQYQIDKLKQEMIFYQTQCRQWQEKCQTAEIQKEESERRIIQMEIRINETKKQIEQQQNDKIQRESYQIHTIQNDLEGWKQKYISLEIKMKDFENYRMKIIELEEQLNNLKNDNYQKQEEVEILISEIKQLQEQNYGYRLSITQLENQARNSIGSDRYKSQIRTLENTINQLNQQINAYKIETKELEQQVMYHQNKDTNVDYLVREKDETISKLQYKLNNMEKELRIIFEEQLKIEQQDWDRQKQQQIDSQLIKITKKYESEISTLKQHFQSLEIENQSLNNKYERLKKEGEIGFQRQSEKEKSRIIELERQIIQLENQLSFQRKEFSMKIEQANQSNLKEYYEAQLKQINEKLIREQNQVQQLNDHLIIEQKSTLDLERRYSKEIKDFKQQQEKRIEFQQTTQYQFELDNHLRDLEKMRKEYRIIEQQYQQMEVQVKLWKEKFYEEQQKHQEIRQQYIEIRSQIESNTIMNTHSDFDKQRIQELEMELFQQQEEIRIKEKKYQELITTYTLQIDKQKSNLDEFKRIKQLEYEIESFKNKCRDLDRQLKDKQLEFDALLQRKQEVKLQTIEVSSQSEKFKTQELESQITSLKLQLQQLNSSKQEVIRETIRETVQIRSAEDIKLIDQLEEELQLWKTKYYELDRRRNQVVVETIKEVSSLERDRQKIYQLECQLQQLAQKKQEVIREYVTEKIEVPLESDQIRIRQLEIQLSNIQRDYQMLSLRKQEILKETITVEVSSQADKNRIQQLETQLSQLSSELMVLRLKKQEVIKETVIEKVEVSMESDKLRINQLQEQLERLQRDYQILNKKKQEVIKETITVEVSSQADKLKIQQLESQVSQLRTELQIVTQKKLEVIREVITERIEVACEADKYRIEQLEQQLQNLNKSYEVLSKKKQEIIKETITVEVPSQSDKFKISQLETQVQQLRQEIQILTLKKQEVIKEVVIERVEVPSSADKFRIQQLEQQLNNLRLELQVVVQKKQEVVREVITEKVEVSKETDRKRILELESDLFRLQQDYINLNKIKSEIIKETFTIEVPSSVDQFRIQQLEIQLQQAKSQLEQQLNYSQQEYFALNQKMQEQIKETITVEVPSESDKYKIRQLESQLLSIQEELNEIQLENQNLHFEISRLEQENRRQTDIIQQLESQIRNQFSIKDFQSQLSNKDKQILQLQDSISGLQATIRTLRGENQTISEQTNRQQVSARESQNSQKFLELETRIQGLNQEISRQILMKDQIQIQYDDLVQRATKYEQEINLLRNQLQKKRNTSTYDGPIVSKTFEIHKIGEVANNGTGLVSGFNLEDTQKIKSIVSTQQLKSEVSFQLSNFQESQYTMKSNSLVQPFNPLRSDLIKSKAQLNRMEDKFYK
ncbi:unnamed protein product (macronuclear) [Paramecium tetraurelia]|uniref:Uncharacterized protein n=1 Tax=Paramecium tetraurelia TaxID=5888 RepID=A0CSD4_PARTE|nr:uncharacterized protein GSPATT00009973001 [Paramecium tetraurelia]CAK73701.1 unnamed protein product [Paramecium tetraurelia]|eukprot:XP_001441098.1 hypothetical protein (macronuclear) [Paramecium tetraurelia strain d4-2]